VSYTLTCKAYQFAIFVHINKIHLLLILKSRVIFSVKIQLAVKQQPEHITWRNSRPHSVYQHWNTLHDATVGHIKFTNPGTR